MNDPDFYVDSRDLEHIRRAWDAYPAQWDKALRSTILKAARWLQVRARRGLSSELQVQQKALRVRLKAMKVKKTSTGIQSGVWAGINPLSLQYLQPKQGGAGVSTRPTGLVKGAFIPGHDKGRPVFKRTSAARLPIEKQTYDITKKAVKAIDRRVFDEAELNKFFLKTLESELKWRTSKP